MRVYHDMGVLIDAVDRYEDAKKVDAYRSVS
jgi:hypothetical protein